MNFWIQILFIFLLTAHVVYSQDDFTDNQDKYQYQISKTNEKVILDGIPDEALWKNMDSITNLWQKRPILVRFADERTIIKMTYDEDFLYIAATCFENDKNVVISLKRDAEIFESDGLSIVIDPANQKTNGFMFGVNAFGAQHESLIGNGETNTDWNNKWFSKTHKGVNKWSVEMAIPFKTLRYKKGEQKWGINFIRNVINQNEFHTWAPVPDQFDGFDLGFLGLLQWDEAPPLVKGNIALIPYASGSYFQDSEDEDNSRWSANTGIDAKVAVTSSLNLDLTVNPDFSQVEVDEQVSNLSRFSIFFPEKRNFFLENSDLFASFGIPPIRPFFSRRIGLDENSEPIPILFGVRLTGNVNNDLRIGVMDVHTAKNEVQAAQNYATAAFSQQIFKRSSISGILTNRQAFDKLNPKNNDYARNAGLSLGWSTEDGKWQSWQQYYHSFKPETTEPAGFLGIGAGYFGPRFQGFIDFDHVGTDYHQDIGFNARINNYDAALDSTIRLGFNQAYSELILSFFPGNVKALDKYEIKLANYLVYNPDWSYNERSHNLENSFEFRNRSELKFNFGSAGVDLLFPIQFTEDKPLPNGIYNILTGGLSYQSDPRKSLSYTLGAGHGGFYNGELTHYSAALIYRYQPWFNFSLKYERNNITFPDPYGSVNLNLFNSRIEFNFSKKLFWTTFLQYNAQNEDFGVNSRFQWRFAPLSDLYLVYTDNYFAPLSQQMGINHRNRALVLKLSYWWNL